MARRRLALLTSSVAAAWTLLAFPAAAADDAAKDSKDESTDMGPVAAAIAGIGIGVIAFGACEAGQGKYPDEHH